ncbi:amine oxidase catalytic domain-containing protein [Punctularia strigosozonata HHB-11173 SS5]|uniref:amine oxidase catalytic domain-containing protein n=1 Tax=Punctularia strigosozonata (strain HHB-11173) TaxID=741275 RepID=UPI0004417E84|nr:amine oxidase catalytic domain-containing protein [Punctularia strigosozonata HHB-11173 SS5]EIN14536.1 amine oxidase catalytic domain-containing protein [Punctularia strigosozonata HHB-11173 SS5]
MDSGWKYEPLGQSEPDVVRTRKPQRSFQRHLGLAVLGLGALCFGGFYVHHSSKVELPDASSHNGVQDQPLRQCPSNLPPPAQPPAPTNPWSSLTVDDTTEIARWLESDSLGLNLTLSHNAQLSDNYIFHIDALRPAKADALAYLNAPSEKTAPARYARVTIHHGSAAEPYIQDYRVGPLPCTGETKIEPLTEIYHRNPIPYHARGFLDPRELAPLARKIIAPLAEVTQDLFGGVALGFENDTLVTGASGPWSFDGSFRRFWISWRRNVPGPWLHPVNFFQYVDVSGTDAEQWKLLKIVYNHQIFGSVEDFLAAYHNGTLKKLPERPDQHEDIDWSTRKRLGAQRDLDHLPGPRQISFGGLRFRIDRKNHYVSWLGWGMYLGFDRDMGMSLWDLRFRGERIIYELSPQEAIAQYAGNDPMQATTAWLDRFFGMGSSVRDMIPGYDCPYEAVYLSATTHSARGSMVRERAICIFEHDTGRPITRHTGYSEGEFGAARGYVLVLRSISTVGNYDYLFDYMFHIDGTIEVRLSASGYLQGGFWESKQEGYGTAIRDTTMGSLHDHVINFKVDLDVAGEKNSLLKTTTNREEITQPWFDDDWGQTVIQQRISREYIQDENDALLKYPLNFQGNYALVNKEELNQWGTPRGYAIHPGYSPVHNTIVGSKRLLENANWARYNLAVSKRKETEPMSSSMWNLHLPGNPMVNFHNFFDGDNITQEDLVAWVNVGMHHLPQAEDSPNTRTNTATSSFFLTPLNYFDWDVSVESSNAILLSAPDVPGGSYKYDDYGVSPVECVPPPLAPFEYKGLKAFGSDGRPAPLKDTEELRKEAELFHRIKVEL